MNTTLLKQIPKPTVNLKYNGNDCTKDFSKYLNSLTFTDFEDEQSDELNITLNNNDGYFSDLWYPEKGDKLTCSIDFDGISFDCGTVTIDENSFDFSTSGDSVEIKALATSTNFSVRTTKIKNHSGKSLRQIANEIGVSYGFTVLGGGGEEKVGAIVQKNESDIAFLKRISKMYGYIFNVKNNGLTFIKFDELESKKALFSLSKTDLKNINLTDTLTKIYGKCSVQYFDNKSKSLKTYTAVGNTEISDTLKIYKKCFSLTEAQQIAAAALKNGSKEVRGTIDISLPLKSRQENNPALFFMAGVNFDLTGLGKFEGLYHIRSSKRTIDSSGLKLKGEIVKI